MRFDQNDYWSGRQGHNWPGNGDWTSFHQGQQDAARDRAMSRSASLTPEQAEAFVAIVWFLLKALSWIAVFVTWIAVLTATAAAFGSLWCACQCRHLKHSHLRPFGERVAPFERRSRHAMAVVSNVGQRVLGSIF